MPTYEYTCTACKHSFEKYESITAKPTTSCPKCKKRKAKRNISGGAGFLFKGSGFYTTDYRSESYKSAAKNDSTTSSTKDSGGGEKKGTTESTAKTTDKSTPAKPAKKESSPKPKK